MTPAYALVVFVVLLLVVLTLELTALLVIQRLVASFRAARLSYDFWPAPGAMFRPTAAADFQYREEPRWHADVSPRAGIEFQGLLAGRNLPLLLEHFRGHSPNGQFYKEKIAYVGLGLHFNF